MAMEGEDISEVTPAREEPGCREVASWGSPTPSSLRSRTQVKAKHCD